MLSRAAPTVDDPLALLAQGQRQLRDDFAAHVEESRVRDELAEKRHAALDAKIGGVEHNLGLEVALLDVKVGKLAQQVSRIEEHVVHLTGVVAGLATRVDRLETRFDGLEARFDGLETRFDGLEGMVGVLLDHFGIARPGGATG